MDASALSDIEEIKQLKARYFRHMDQKRWDEWQECFTEDITAVYERPPRLSQSDASDQISCHGRAELLEGVRTLLRDAVSMHQGFMPEIELTSPTSATGIWAMFDYVRMPRCAFKGWGHYHEEYVKRDGRWMIKKIRLTRLHTEELW